MPEAAGPGDSGAPLREGAGLSSEEAGLFGFTPDDRWLAILRRAQTTRAPLGSIGTYELIEEAQRGGQGVVYRARQPGMGREVALKRLVAGSLAGERDRRRFEAEIEAVATLQHPGIVTVYGIESVDGLPVLAMEWIEGQAITAWARSQPEGADPRGILEVFLQVCEAVHHAHQNGILHRDLKPANILVDEEGRPRVLDFGLAIPLAGPGASRSGFAGTLGYSSPEQVEGGRGPLDARSDVYSLGVVLYELLAGEPPWPEELGLGERLLAMERAVWQAPSRRRPGLRADFDAIVRQALAFDPDRRYASVGHLADDVRRYLRGEPVLAHGPSALYELRRLLGRHRAIASLSALLLVSLLAFAFVTRRQAEWIAKERDDEALARRAAEDALEREALARSAAEAALLREERALEGERSARAEAERAGEEEARAREAADESRRRAEKEARDARALSNFFLDDVLLNLTGPGQLELTLEDALDYAVGALAGRFEGQPDVEAAVRRRIGQIFAAHGRQEDARFLLEGSLALLAEAGLEDLHQIGHGELSLGVAVDALNRPREAVPHLERAIWAFAEQEPPDYRQWARARRLLGRVQAELQRVDESRASYEEALALFRAHDPENFFEMSWAMLGLAELRVTGGELAQGRRELEELLAFNHEHFGPESEGVGTVLERLAGVDLLQGETERAVAKVREAVRVLTPIFGASHPRLALTRGLLAEALLQSGERREAEWQVRETLEIYRDPRRFDPVVVFSLQAQLVRILRADGRPGEAAEAQARIVTAHEGVEGTASPQAFGARGTLAELLFEAGRAAEALAEWDRALGGARQNPQAWPFFAGDFHVGRARALFALGRHEEAFADLELGLDALARHPLRSEAELAVAIEEWIALWEEAGEEQRVGLLRERLEGLGS